MSFFEALGQNWKFVLTIAVLVVVNVLTFSAQEMTLQRERELSASLIANANEGASRETRLLATNAAQSTRITELESALSTAERCPTETPARVSRVSTPTTSAITGGASASPSLGPTATAAASPFAR